MQKQLSLLTTLFIGFLSYDCQSVSYKGYNTYEPGNMNIFISSPHGGTLLPTDIPDRIKINAKIILFLDYYW